MMKRKNTRSIIINKLTVLKKANKALISTAVR